MAHARTTLIGLTRDELESFAAQMGQPAYRGRQIFRWLHHRRARTFAEMTDLPQALRQQIEASAEVGGLKLIRQTTAAGDGTRKLLYELGDGLQIESVYLPNSPGDTVCVSTQVGCAIGCPFCATGAMGLHRNLTAGEIVLQVLETEAVAGRPLTNVVFMGMGEPLQNYDSTLRSLRILTDRDGLAIPRSRITVSTVGIVPMIERWTADHPPAKLALSLHAATDEQRRQIVPVAKAYPLDRLMKAMRQLAHATHHPLTFEYIMIAAFNDRREDAKRLKELVRNIPAKINLIRLHPTGSPFSPSSDETIHRFMGWLVEEGLDCTLRRSRGVEDKAACGMLCVDEPVTLAATRPPLSSPRS